jgi:hypothetical protein
MKYWWNDTDGGKTAVLGEKALPVRLMVTYGFLYG